MSDKKDERLYSQVDFILLKKYEYSLQALLLRYKGKSVPSKTAANALNLTEEEFDEEFQRVVSKLREIMKVDADE